MSPAFTNEARPNWGSRISSTATLGSSLSMLDAYRLIDTRSDVLDAHDNRLLHDQVVQRSALLNHQNTVELTRDLNGLTIDPQDNQSFGTYSLHSNEDHLLTPTSTTDLNASFNPSLLNINPSQVQWVYLDSQNNIQGPFDGNMMQSWYSANYLTPDLRLKRVEDSSFQSLGDLIVLTGNYHTPFLVPVPTTAPHPSLSFASQNSTTSIPQRVGSPWLSQQSPITVPLSPFANSTSLLSENSIGAASVLTDNSIATPNAFVSTQTLVALEPQLGSETVEVLEEPLPINENVTPVLESEAQKEIQEEPVKQEEVESVAEKTQPSPQAEKRSPARPKLAPWASSSSVSTKPKLSLLEIQELEDRNLAKEQLERLKELERERELEKEREREAQLKSVSSTIAAVEDRPLLPKTASWASVSVSTSRTAAPKKTLAEIQKEEAEAHLLFEAKERRANTLAAKLAEQTNNAANSGNPWITVSKKPVVKPAVSASGPGVLNMSSKATNPSALRSVSSTTSSTVVKPVTVTVPTVNKPMNSRDEFFQWCRQQLSKLNKGVDREDLLSILIQFPASNESQEIIGDTIYSNSSTMDGRKFAMEFCKKKQLIEKSVPRGVELNWMEEMQRTLKNQTSSNAEDLSFASSTNDDWDDAFKVVSKKNKRKGNREF